MSGISLPRGPTPVGTNASTISIKYPRITNIEIHESEHQQPFMTVYIEGKNIQQLIKIRRAMKQLVK